MSEQQITDDDIEERAFPRKYLNSSEGFQSNEIPGAADETHVVHSGPLKQKNYSK